jgi:hypothetical protein
MTTGLEELTFHIRGLTPLILHNGRLNDPLDPFAIALDKATKTYKKTKTISALMDMARAEFMGSLYVGDDGAPCAPGECLEAAIRSGAKRTKDGKAVQTGLVIEGNVPIIYDGPKTAEALWEYRSPGANSDLPMAGRKFADRRRAKVGQNAVMRTRPIFQEWEMEFTVKYDSRLINKSALKDFVEATAEHVGLFEMRPKFGRFEVLKAFCFLK